MTARTKKYISPSTPTISHDLTNFIVEAILINRHGALPEAAWRKGRPFAKEWGEILKKVRSVKKVGVNLEQLAWAVQFYKMTNLDFDEFGLLRWKVQKYFKWCNVERFVNHYITLHSTLIGESSSYVEETTTYKTKKPGSRRRQKTLTEIIEELENECGASNGSE